MKKKLLLIFALLVALYSLTEWIIHGIYRILFSPNKYMSFVLPLVHLTKYFVIASILIWLFKRYAILAPAGEKLIPIFFKISVAGIFITILWFNAVSEEKLIKYRVAWWNTHTWDEVVHVTPKLYREDPTSRPENVNQLTPLNVYTKYIIHFNDGSNINAWNNLPSVYRLHQFVLSNGLHITYDKSINRQFLEQNYSSYFNKEMPKARIIFGVE